MIVKKIYSIVSEKDFYAFRDRCYQEGKSIGDTFAEIVIAYARGKISIISKEKVDSEKVKHLNQYLKDHNKEGGKQD